MKSRGFTLIEMLVAIGIFSIVIGSLFTIGDYVSKRSMAARNESKRLLGITNFLSELSDSIKYGKGVLYVSSREIGLWKEDKDQDGRPYPDETVSIMWDGRGTLYRRVGYEETPIINGVETFELAFDEPAPKTKHILVRLGIAGTVYQTSLTVR